MKEVEILVEVLSDKKEALAKFKHLNFKGIKKTLDIYLYNPANEKLKPGKDFRLKECCRIRVKDGKSYLAYKVDNFENGKWVFSDEHEVEISDSDVGMKILAHLGLKPLVEIENEKHTFMTNWKPDLSTGP